MPIDRILPPTLDIPGLGTVQLEPNDPGSSPEVNAATASYCCEAQMRAGPPITGRIMLMLPRYTRFDQQRYVHHMGELWAELPRVIEQVKPSLQRLIAAEIIGFAHQDASAGARLAEALFNPLRLNAVWIYPVERYWRWWRMPQLLLKEGPLMTVLGLLEGNQAYQLEIDVARISKAVGRHDLFVTAGRGMRKLSVNFDG